MSKLQTYYYFQLDFQKVHQHTGGKWLNHAMKRRKDNIFQLQIIQQIRSLRNGNILNFVIS